jgi:hypothetical protein
MPPAAEPVTASNLATSGDHDAKPAPGGELCAIEPSVVVDEHAPPGAAVKVVRPRLRLRALHLDLDTSPARARTHDNATGNPCHQRSQTLTGPAPSEMPIGARPCQ